MKECKMRYGCNPNQKTARAFVQEGKLPFQILNGKPGYINLLDALNAWQLARALKQATGLPSATSFKHVSPAGAAVGIPLTALERQIYWINNEAQLTPMANAYARARGADRMSSYGDFIAVSDVCDTATALLIRNEVSDGIIAPSYEREALEILRQKKRGNYCVIQMDESYIPNIVEQKDVFGITMEQERNATIINRELFGNIVTRNKDLPEQVKLDLMIALITLKYTQSNSVCYVKGGQAIGIGAGQQSRIHCTRLAGQKADHWFLRQHPKVRGLSFKDKVSRVDRDNGIDMYIGDEDDYMDLLSDGNWENLFTSKPGIFTREEKKAWLHQLSGVALASDAFFPFGDNIHRAYRSGVKYIAQPGGSIRDDNVIEACDKHGLVMCFTGIRLFHH